ncbi:MAG: DUF126 domain-containing protein [Burkholderiales bacterium]
MAERPSILRGACVVEGCADAVEGEAMVCEANLAFALIDPRTGVVKQPGHPWLDRSIAGKVLVYPTGQGSSSGSWWLLNLAHEGCAPAAIVNAQSDVVVIAGAVLANIPLVHRVSPDPFANIASGDRVRVVAREGTVEVVSAESSR